MPSFVPTPEPGRQSPPAPQRPPAIDSLLIPVLADKRANSWPLYPQGQPALYLPLAEAFGRLYATDAHFAAYSVPQLLRRLAKDEALVRLAEQGGVPMVLFVTDVDAPGHVATEAWWQAEQAKLAALAQVHPGLFAYRTRGGYRIVYVLAVPVVLLGAADKEAWKRRYWRWCLYLSRRFAIVADPSCADWTRLYRLPHVTREPGGQPEQLTWVGEPHAMGLWTVEPTEEDLGADLLEAHRLVERTRPANPAQPSPWAGVGRALMGAPGAGTLSLPHAADARPEPTSYTPTPVVAAEPVSGVRPSLQERQRRWCQALLDKLCAELASSPAGDRNNALNRTALLAGHYVPHLLDLADVERRLLEGASRCGLLREDASGTRATLASGLQAGMRTPKWPDLADDARPTPLPVATDEPTRAARPCIQVNHELARIVDESLAALASVEGLNLYTRNGELVQVLRSTDEQKGRRDAGMPYLRPLPLDALWKMLAEYVDFYRLDKRGQGQAEVPCLPSAQSVKSLFAQGEWPGLRPLVGLLETPFLRPDGSVCSAPGYDEATGYLLLSPETFHDVPEAPQLDEAQRALGILCEPFAEFPFATDAARSVVLAAILTLLARPAIGAANTPCFVFDANAPGTGKSLLCDVVCVVATGRTAPKTGYPSSDEEMGKLLASVALGGVPLLVFDNVTRTIGGGDLDRVLTCSGSVGFRLLGVNKDKRCTWRTVVLATGNAVVVRGDSSRRVLVCEQETLEERPEEREGFRYPDLIGHVREHRGRYVAAALTLLRAYLAAGAPRVVRPLGSFEAWSKLVAGALVWAGAANPLDALAESSRDDDPQKTALRVLLAQWPKVDPEGGGLTARELVAKLYPVGAPGGGSEGALAELREAVEVLCGTTGGKPPSPQQLARRLRAFERRTKGGRRLIQTKGHGGFSWWRVESVKSIAT